MTAQRANIFIYTSANVDDRFDTSTHTRLNNAVTMLSRCQRLSIASKYNRSLSSAYGNCNSDKISANMQTVSLPQGAHFIDEKDSSDDGYANLSKSSTRQGPAEAANYSWDAVFDGLPDAVPIRATLPTRMSRASLGPKFFSRNELPGSRRKYSTQAPGSSRYVSSRTSL